MQSVGIRLRQARVEQKQTLEEISGGTRISLKNLTAIESDELAKFSSPFIYRSFVRKYGLPVKDDYGTLTPDEHTTAATISRPIRPGQRDRLPAPSALILAPRTPTYSISL